MTKEIELDTPLHLLVKPLTPSTPPSTHRSTHHPPPPQNEPVHKPAASCEMARMYLTDGYEKDTLIFKRYANENCNKRGKKEFFSSLFVGI
jgi:hypothetical protein